MEAEGDPAHRVAQNIVELSGSCLAHWGENPRKMIMSKAAATPQFQAFECQGNIESQPMHCHEEIEFAAVCRGRGILQSGQVRQSARPGVFSVVCPYEPHAGTPLTPDCVVQVVNVPLSWFAGHQILWTALWRRAAVREGEAALPLLHQFFGAVHNNDSRLEQDELLLALYGATAHQPEAMLKTYGEAGRIKVAISLLRERFDEEIPLSKLAAIAELSPSYFCRAFKKQLGITPHAYQNALRVARAKTLLEAGQSAADVALEVGFYDQSHLIRHFKRFLGTTPAFLKARAISSYPRATLPE